MFERAAVPHWAFLAFTGAVVAAFHYGVLHRRGGLPFSLLALALPGSAVLIVRLWERQAAQTRVREVQPA